ncbi:MAG: hypothetical protein J6Z02_07640 [Lachnospiraceae bacterium]|jgi:hypothetical protein|nr:hypothetical protein [Lachnospiraceae bacterium]MBR6395888.1 hypothetical protein [Lachnospiraceae bacterium]
MEDMAVFKSYLRGLLFRLKAIKEANKNGDKEEVDRLVSELIDETQKGIED